MITKNDIPDALIFGSAVFAVSLAIVACLILLIGAFTLSVWQTLAVMTGGAPLAALAITCGALWGTAVKPKKRKKG